KHRWWHPPPGYRTMRHSGFSSAMRSLARAAAQAERARQRAQNQAEAAARRTLRDAERRSKADAREATRDYLAAQIEEAETLTKPVWEGERAAETLPARALTETPAIDLQARVQTFTPAEFDERTWPSSPPQKMLPEAPGFVARLVPGASGRH